MLIDTNELCLKLAERMHDHEQLKEFVEEHFPILINRIDELQTKCSLLEMQNTDLTDKLEDL